MEAEWAEVLIEAPSQDEINGLAAKLVEELPGLEFAVGQKPEVLLAIVAPPPQRVFVQGLAARRSGHALQELRVELKQTLARLGIQYDEGTLPDTLDLVVIFL